VLEAALEDFEGTLLTVSHDRYFINRVATKVIEMSPDGAVEYLGNYDDYLEKKRVQNAGESEWSADSGATRTQIDKEKRRQRLAKESAKALQAKLKKAEDDIAATEQRIAGLEAQMGLPEVYANPAESARVAREHKDAQDQLDALYELWEELSEAVN
jgi:ATP-binding cassette subfamily F protein 3